MKVNPQMHSGVVVPMLTPITADGALDGPAVDRIVELLSAGGVDGIFVLGTTGEGVAVPEKMRQELVKRVVADKRPGCRVYAGLGDLRRQRFAAANEFFEAGADAVVAHPPVSERVAPPQLEAWYRDLLDQLKGSALIYNMPSTTGVSIPLEAIEHLLGHPRLAGVKDSENNPARHEELLKRFGGRDDFSIFIGVGALMESGLRLGAHGIVPSVGNLIPESCAGLCATARRGDWDGAQVHAGRMLAVAALYQKGRTLDESLAALKAAAHVRGLCAPHVFPPLKTFSPPQVQKLRREMELLHLLNGK